jgi:hypothetical protein
MSRKYIDEICDKRTRKPEDGDSIWEFMLRLENVRLAANEIKNNNFKCKTPIEKEFMRGLPITAVSALEGYLSSVFGLVVDKGDPYLTNIQSLKDVKLDVSSLVSMKKQGVSIGDVLAHFLCFSKLPDIDKNFTVLLGVDFIKSVSDKAKEHKSNIAKCIDIRNFLAHELATGYEYSANEH